MDKKTLDLGLKKGKMLLFGGVYSNLQALKAVIKFAVQHDIAPQSCMSTGDIIGYCGQPQETLDLFQAWGALSILGNVEIQLRDDQQDCGCDFTAGSRCDGFSDIWYAFAKANLKTTTRDFFKTLPDYITFKYAGRSMGVVHGSTTQVSEFIFKSTPWHLKAPSFNDLKVNTIVAGHCGLPFSQVHGDRLWLNPGVIGMPANDGTTRTWAILLDDTAGFSFNHVSLEYDYKTTVSQMGSNQLPAAYALTLQTGIWDNMEILPIVEREHQGKTLRFTEKEPLEL